MHYRLARLLRISLVCILTLAGLALARPVHAQSTPVLTATSISHSQINVSWTSAGAGYTYNLFRRTTTGSETEIAMNQTGLTFSDTGLGSSTPYFYKVTVVGGSGPTSAEKEAVTSPSGVAATAGDAEVALTWNAPNPSYVTYSVSRSPGGPLATGLTTASYLDTTAVNQTAYTYQITATSNDAGAVSSAPAPPTVAVTPMLQINAGGSALTSAGATAPAGTLASWGADNGSPSPLTSGRMLVKTNTIMNVPANVPVQVFQSQRQSDSAYTISEGGNGFSFPESGLPNGNYTLTLYFAETGNTITGPGLRTFNVFINGAQVLTNFDIYATAGGKNIAVSESFPVTVTGGQFSLDCQDVVGKSLLAAFALGPPPSFAADVPAPDWAQDVIPMDDAGAGGAGPSDGISADLASGIEENQPGPDLSVYNPAGPRAMYERMYRSSRALSGTTGYGSPGLSPGWMDNYDYQVTNNSGTYTLTYPNGSTETWTGTTGSLTVPTGAPYLAAASSPTLTMTFKDRSVYTFTLDSGSTTQYRLTGIANVVKHAITIARDGSHRLLTVKNDASSVVTLLSFTYPTATTMKVTDAYGRFVNLTFGTLGSNTVLTDVSQIATSGTPADQWTYGYTAISTANNLPFLNSVQTPDPSSPPATGQQTSVYSKATVLPNANGTVYQMQDARQGSLTGMRILAAGASGQTTLTVLQNSSAPTTNVVGVAQYGAQNKATASIDAKNQASSAAYTDTHNPYQPTSVTNRNGQTTTYVYDQNLPMGDPYSGSLTTMTDNRGDVETMTYKYPSDFPLGQLQMSQLTHETNGTTDATREATSYTYYGTGSAFNGLIDTIVAPLPGTVYPSTSTVTTTYVYDPTLVNANPLGNVQTVTYPAPNATAGATETVTYNYTTDNNPSYSQTASVGEPLTATDANGNVTHFRYDARGNRITVIDGQGYETDTYYNIADQVQAVAFPPTTGTARAVEYYTYEYPGGPVENVALYSEGQLTIPTPGSLFPAPGSGVSPFRQTVTNYGHEGEVLSVSDLVGTVASYTYDGDYRTVTSADGLGNTSGYVYDLRGDLLQEQYPATYNSVHGAIQAAGTTDTMTYGYDNDQNPLLTVDGRGVVTALVRSDPESLPTQKSYGGLPIQNNGVTIDLRTAPSISGTGSTITLGSLPSGVSSIAAVDLAYDVWGRMASMVDGTGTMTYGDPANSSTPGYDDLDRILLTTKSFSGGPQGQQLAYSYFQDGSLHAMTLPGASQVSNPVTSYNSGQFSYVYDPGGRLANLYVPWRVSSEGVGSTNKFNFLYLNNNWLNYFSGDLGYCQYNYDGRGFLTSLADSSYVPETNPNSNWSSMIADYGNFTYDAAGNRTGEQMQSQAADLAFAWDHALTWTYDGRDRLTHEHCVGLSSASVPSQPSINYDQYFGYDGADNLTNYKDPMAGQMADFGFNVDNQANNPMGFSFDGAGSMLAEPTGGLFQGDTLAYDPEERLVSATSGSTTLLANTYDGAGVREIKTTAADGTTYFLLDASGAPVVEETYTGTTATLSRINAFGADGLRARYAPLTGSETMYFYDPQGTVVSRIVSNESGVESGDPFTDICVWDGYGQQRTDQWASQRSDAQYTANDPVGFAGQSGYYADWELAQEQTLGSNQTTWVFLTSTPSLLTHRYYDASTGRFVNRDPIGYGGGANLYAYCGGNPVNRKDPHGTQSPIGDGTYEDPWEYLSNGLDHSTPMDWWNGFKNSSVTRAVIATANIACYIPDPANPGFDYKVGELAVEGGTELVGTGAFKLGAESGGEGLGLFASRTLKVSSKGLGIVESHLEQFGEAVPENTMMIGRIKEALSSGKAISGADAIFYTHEIYESVRMAELIGKEGKTAEEAYDIAHGNALSKYSVSQFSVYAPEVIRALPGNFSSAWRNFWGIK